jgi:TonB family protein
MKKYDGKLVGILGAIIVHLIAAIIFMLVKISSLNIKEYSKEYELTLEEPIVQQDQLKPNQQAYTNVEQILSGDQELLNIARNLAKQPDVNINKENYIDMVKEEMIRDGKLGRENYIDEWKQMKENSGETSVSIEKEKNNNDDEEKPDRSQEIASMYSGPTRIYYDLEGRTHTYLPLPIYKCQGAGKIVLTIEVTPKGAVTSASVIEKESTTGDPCLVETAVKTALISRFNADIKALRNQTGTLTYHFVAQ